MVFNSAAMAASIRVEAAGIGFPEQGFELGEGLLDRVQIRAVFGQVEQLGTRAAYRTPDRRVAVTAEVVHHDDVAWPQGGDQDLLNPGEEAVGIDRSIEQARRPQTVTAQSRDEGERLTSSVRHLGEQTLALGATAVRTGHVGLDPCLIDEIQSCRRDLALMGLPLPAPPRDIGAILLTGTQALFLKLSPA
jgi:hypothetical protein